MAMKNMKNSMIFQNYSSNSYNPKRGDKCQGYSTLK